MGKNTRLSYSKINEVLEMPNLIEVQKDSYKWFLEEGLKEVFHDISPIKDHSGHLVMEFFDYRLDYNPKYTVEECVVIALLEKPCVFKEMASNNDVDVSVVFMLILNNNKQVEALSRLVKIIQSEKEIQSIYEDDGCKKMYDSFGKYLR